MIRRNQLYQEFRVNVKCTIAQILDTHLTNRNSVSKSYLYDLPMKPYSDKFPENGCPLVFPANKKWIKLKDWYYEEYNSPMGNLQISYSHKEKSLEKIDIDLKNLIGNNM
jgi:hypothetical protein